MQYLGPACSHIGFEEKYVVLHRDKLTIPIHMQLSQKQKNLSQFFAAFLKSRFIFTHFKRKEEPLRLFILEVTDSKDVVKEMSKKSLLRGCLEKQYEKPAQALSNSSSQHFFHIHWVLKNDIAFEKMSHIDMPNLRVAC